LRLGHEFHSSVIRVCNKAIGALVSSPLLPVLPQANA
jgi:hypothetical protein